MAKDPYKLLGIDRKADEKAIKSAYRKLAKKYHPDVNPGAANKFKEITAAYNLLSDPQLKSQYDSGQVDANGQQQNPFQGQNPFGGGYNPYGGMGAGGMGGSGPRSSGTQTGGADDMAQLLESLFGMKMGGRGAGSPFGGGKKKPSSTKVKKGGNVRYRVSISFFDAWTGLTKIIRPKAGGVLNVEIPAGTKSGETITLTGRGKPSPNGGRHGDAVIAITVTPHKFFRFEGDKLILDLPVTLNEALNGAKIPVKLPRGEVSVTVPGGEKAGQKLRLKGKGIQGGDIIIRPIITLDSMTVNALSATDLPKQAEIASEIRRNL